MATNSTTCCPGERVTARGVSGPIVALTGTPGTGKSAVGTVLRAEGHPVLELSRYVGDARFDLGQDGSHHDAVVLDEEALGDFLAEHLVDALGLAAGHDGPVFVESHLAHELSIVDRVIVLRCRPSVLAKRLAPRHWPETKVRANLEAEALDLIVQEAAQYRDEAAADGLAFPVGEVDTTESSPQQVAARVLELATAPPAQLQIGTVDWADEVLGWY